MSSFSRGTLVITDNDGTYLPTLATCKRQQFFLTLTVRSEDMPRNKYANYKNSHRSRDRDRKNDINGSGDAYPSSESMFFMPISDDGDPEPSCKPCYNPLKGLQLRMWDFAQCDPKRCTGARLARRGVFRTMPLKQPFRGIVLSPNGTVSVSPADRPIVEELVRSEI